MPSSVLEKLKTVLDFSILSNFDIMDLMSDSYIPVCISKGVVYVVVTASTKQDAIKSVIENRLCTSKISFKVCTTAEFNVVMEYVQKNIPQFENVNEDDIEDIEIDDSSEIHLKYDDSDIEEIIPIEDTNSDEYANNNVDSQSCSQVVPSDQKFYAI